MEERAEAAAQYMLLEEDAELRKAIQVRDSGVSVFSTVLSHVPDNVAGRRTRQT
jgi:hypothetical protein